MVVLSKAHAAEIAKLSDVWKYPEVSSADFDWLEITHPTFPQEAKKAIPSWMFVDATPRFTKGDLNDDKVFELIIASPQFFSGGTEYAILGRQKGKWHCIAEELQGGLVIYQYGTKNGYSQINTWPRSGSETFHQVWKFSKGKYRNVFTQTLPLGIAQSRFWHCYWSNLNNISLVKKPNQCE
jgi:hypothetical protein